MIDTQKSSYNHEQVEELKSDIIRMIKRWDQGRGVDLGRLIRSMLCLNLLGIAYDKETKGFSRDPSGGVDWLL